MLIAIQDLNGLLLDMMGVIAMEGFHAGSVRESLIAQAHAPTRYGMPVYELTAVRPTLARPDLTIDLDSVVTKFLPETQLKLPQHGHGAQSLTPKRAHGVGAVYAIVGVVSARDQRWHCCRVPACAPNAASLSREQDATEPGRHCGT